MTNEIADWKITVYALGELEGEDREAVERAIAEDPELAARVDMIRRQAEDVAFTLAAEPMPEPRPVRRSGLPRRFAAVAALAAIFVIAWSATWGVQRPRTSSESSARVARARHLEEAGRAAFQASEFERATELLARALAADPTNEDARRLLQVASKAQKRQQDEITAMQRLAAERLAQQEADREIAARRTGVHRRFEQALVSFEGGRYREAEQLCNECLLLDPEFRLAKDLKVDVMRAYHNETYATFLKTKIERWKQTMEDIDEATVAYADDDLVRWPSHEYWEAVRGRVMLPTMDLMEGPVPPTARVDGQDVSADPCDALWSEQTLQGLQTAGTVAAEHDQSDETLAMFVNDPEWQENSPLSFFLDYGAPRKAPADHGAMGSIQANGGTVLLDANAVEDVFSSLVNNSGVIQAGSLNSAGGSVTLTAADTWGADANEDVFGGRDIFVGPEIRYADTEATYGCSITASSSNNLAIDRKLAESISTAASTFGGTVGKRTLGKLAVDPKRPASPEVGYCYGLEIGAVTTTEVRGHSAQITLSGGIDIDAVWRSDNLVAVLNREGASSGTVSATRVGDDSDSDSAWSPLVSLRTDAYLASHVSNVIELNGTGSSIRPPTAPEAPILMSLQYGDIPVLGTLGIITLPGPGEAKAPVETPGTEGYAPIVENPFMHVTEEALTTFSIDVDTASYANVRRYLHMGQLPPPDAVRIEELVNYFPYDYAPPTDDRPFAVHLEMAACPWKNGHRLLRVGLKGRVPQGERPACNLVFLVDVSGSMEASNKLPLVQAGLRLLVKEMTARDRIAIVTYAGTSGVALPSTPGDERTKILDVLNGLRSGGSTNGASGVETAYELAADHFIQGGTNRVVLATDGDWNVGVTSHGDLVRLIEEKAKSGVFLTVLGFGMGNLKDDTLEKLADKGNGNYAYVDGLSEARKVLVEEMGATLQTIAKDVKIQIEFNPARIAGYRLIGYENRMLAKQDFADDKKDAGEIGAGHTVTALYEVVPVGEAVPGQAPPVPPRRYQTQGAGTAASNSTEACIVKLRYKAPDGDTSALIEVPFEDKSGPFDEASEDFRFATAVAGYGMLLRKSVYAKGLTWDGVEEIAGGSVGKDDRSYRGEFVELVRRAKEVSR